MQAGGLGFGASQDRVFRVAVGDDAEMSDLVESGGRSRLITFERITSFASGDCNSIRSRDVETLFRVAGGADSAVDIFDADRHDLDPSFVWLPFWNCIRGHVKGRAIGIASDMNSWEEHIGFFW